MKKVLFGFIILGLLVMPLALADGVDGHEGGMMGGSYGYGGMFFGWILSILVIVVLVLLIIWLIKQIQKR
ncbi:MAG: hypothetical protein KKF56_02025 [Nanoarchaeota archaeon]|nr:hypothetical protein [Nanoarchaeota archaeon]